MVSRNFITWSIYSQESWYSLRWPFCLCHCILTLTHCKASRQPDTGLLVNYGIVMYWAVLFAMGLYYSQIFNTTCEFHCRLSKHTKQYLSVNSCPAAASLFTCFHMPTLWTMILHFLILWTSKIWHFSAWTQYCSLCSAGRTLWRQSVSKCYLRIQSVPQREHQTSPLQRSTG
jgi:hypothetical protein